MTDFDMISEFGTLDELIQVIYQGANKFVVLSSVADDAWSVYLTLANSEGRWWTGRWTEKDVLDFVVSCANCWVSYLADTRVGPQDSGEADRAVRPEPG